MGADPLTGQQAGRYRSRLLDAECARARRYGSRLAVLLVAVDDFTQGSNGQEPPVTNEVIKQLGLLMRRLIRDVDIVLRYGTDEFLILLPETDTSGAKRLAERICGEILCGAMFFDALSAHMTVNIGAYSPSGDDAIEPMAILRRAELALGKAKAAGTNRVVAH